MNNDDIDNKAILSEWLEFLANIAFVGIENGYFDEAQKILSTLVEVRPNNVNAKIAQAIGELMMCNLQKGTTMLLSILKENKDNETAKGFLAIAFKISKADNEAISISKHILKSCKNEDTRLIAQNILDNYKKVVTPQSLQAQMCINIAKKTHKSYVDRK